MPCVSRRQVGLLWFLGVTPHGYVFIARSDWAGSVLVPCLGSADFVLVALCDAAGLCFACSVCPRALVWFLSVHLRALFLLVGTAVLVARCDCTARLQEW